MSKVNIWDKRFKLFIVEDDIKQAISECAKKINKDFEGVTDENCPIIVSVLNGAFMFTSDIAKEIHVPCEISFVKVSSYTNTSSNGKVKELIGLNRDITGRDIILTDDIIDSGLTMFTLKEQLLKQGARSVKVCGLIYKAHACTKDLKVDYACIEMNDNNFIVGYGLDYNEIGRQFKDIYILEE